MPRIANNGFRENEGRRELHGYLEEAGLQPQWLHPNSARQGFRPDAEADIRLPGGEPRRLVVEFKANPRRAPVQDAVIQLRNYLNHSNSRSGIPLVFSSHLGEPMRNWLRSQNVWFADQSGNRFFSERGLLVDREMADRKSSHLQGVPGLFSDSNSRVLRHLIARPPFSAGVRELAQLVGVSAAAVSVVLRRLRELGHLNQDRNKLHLLDREGLLQEWIAFYRPRFRRQHELRLYVHARDAEAIVQRIGAEHAALLPNYGLSLHAGASLVAPFVQFREVHVYFPEWQEADQDLLRGLGAKEAEAEANLVLLEPFYRNSVLYDSQVIRGVRVVSNVQLFLDLSCYPRRGAEQAEIILDRLLRPSWSGQ